MGRTKGASPASDLWSGTAKDALSAFTSAKGKRAIADAGWRLFRTLLESKVRLYGRQVRIISRWQPTSQACCACGHKGGKKPCPSVPGGVQPVELSTGER